MTRRASVLDYSPTSPHPYDRRSPCSFPAVSRDARPPPAAVKSVEVSVDDLRYCSRCERWRSSSQSFSVRLRWHRQHPRRPNIVVRRRPICRLITRPHVDPASVSRAVLRVYRQTRLAGQDRIPGDTLALGRQAAHGRAAADRGQ